MELQNYITGEVEAKIRKLIEAKKIIAAIESEIKEGLLKVMQDNGITSSIKGNGYTIIRAKRDTIKFTGTEVPEEFAMTVVSKAKVKAKLVLEGELPADFELSTSEYLTFKESK
jgi:hypothetical protein